MSVMEYLKIFTLPLESRITREPLPSGKILSGIIDTLDRSIASGLFDRDQYRGNAVFDHQTKRPRVAIAAPKRQGIFQLEEIRHPHSLSAPHAAVGDLTVILIPL